jgi:hypothetical protein
MLSARSFVVIGLTCLLHLVSPETAVGQATSLEFKSQPGDYIGGGIDQTFTPADGIFTAVRNFDNGVTIDFNGGPHWWFLNFAAPQDAPLLPGVYENASRWPFHSPTGAGMDISGEGRGCNRLTGRFEVLEAVYRDTGEVERFAATFEQHCEGGVPALLGAVLFNSTLPPPPPPPMVCLSKVATIPALLVEVGMLQTSGTTQHALQQFLLAAQWGLDNSHARLARSSLSQFISRAVHVSNLRPANPNAIAVIAADSLACGASNVLTNIALPR